MGGNRQKTLSPLFFILRVFFERDRNGELVFLATVILDFFVNNYIFSIT
jgi:hypothetical protein